MATPVVKFNPATGKFDMGGATTTAPAVPAAPTTVPPQPQGKYTYEQIGARIRQANPEAFSAFTDAQIGERAAQRKPELQAAVSGGSSAPPASFNVPSSAPAPTSGGGVGGFVKEAAKGFLRPFATLGVTAAAVPHSLAKLATGDVAGAQKITDEGYNLPFVGQVRPAKIGADIGEKNVLGMNMDTLRTLGTGAELAANVAPLGVGEQAGKAIAQQGLKTGLKTFAKPLLKEGAAIGAAQSLGSSLQDEKVTPGSVALNTTIGTGAGAAFGLGGQIAAQGLRRTVQPAIRAVAPFLTNIPKVDINWAIANEKAVMPKIQIIKEALESGQPELAEAALRKDLFNLAAQTANSAKEKVGAAFQAGVEKMQKQFPNAAGDAGKIWQFVLSKKPAIGMPRTQDETTALNAVMQTVRAQRDMTVGGLAQLKRNLWEVANGLDEGSPARRMAMSVFHEVDKELNRITNGGMKKYNDMWSALMKDWEQISPIVSKNVTEDAARNFTSSLLNATKGGSREALERLSKIAGIGQDAITNELRASRVARALMQEAGRPGSRVRDLLISGVTSGLGASVGGVVGGLPGAIAGGTMSAGLGAMATSPRFLSQFLFEGGEKAAQKAAGEAVQGAGAALEKAATKVLPKKVNVAPRLEYKTGVPIKSAPLFRAIPGSKGGVEEVVKKFKNPVVFENDQIELIDKLIASGVPGAEKAKGVGTYPKTRDNFIDQYFKSKGYDAIVYKKTSTPMNPGVEIRDIKTGKSYAIKPETARLYSFGS